MNSETLPQDDVVLAVDNSLARKRILDLVFKEVEVPHAMYDLKNISHGYVQGLLRITFDFFLPKTRRIRRHTAVIGGDLWLIVHVWAVPGNTAKKLSILSYGTLTIEGADAIRVHVAAPLRDDMAGVNW